MICPICFLNGGRHDGGDVREHFVFTCETGFSYPHKDRHYIALRVPGIVAPLLKRIFN